MKLTERVAALEAELVGDDADREPILVRLRPGRIGGREFTDDEIIGVRADSTGAVTRRTPREPLADLLARAAAAVPPGHPLRRLVCLAQYRAPDSTCGTRDG